MTVTGIGGHHHCMHEVRGWQGNAADRDAQANPRPTPAARLSNQMIREMDTDSDGTLCQCETGLSEEAFSGIDGNADGILTRVELAGSLRANREDVAAAIGLERPEGYEPPEPGEGHPVARRAYVRKALDSYEGTYSDLLHDVFGKAAAGGEADNSIDTAV